MDAGYLNFHKEEDFSSYFLESFNDDSRSFDGTNSNSYKWDCEEERELNGDVGLIPISSQTDDFCPLSSSPPSREDFNKIMTDWNHLVNLEGHDDLIVGIDISTAPPEDLITPDGFDITKYVTEPAEEKPRYHGKRIDMARRRYVVDDDEEDREMESSEDDEESEAEPEAPSPPPPPVANAEVKKIESEDEDEDCTVDVETVTDNTSHPVLQAGDLKSLLEQFEATECTNLELQQSQPGIIFEQPNMTTPEKLLDTSISSVDSVSMEEALLSPQVTKSLVSPIKSPIRRSEIAPRSRAAKELQLLPPPPPQKETVPAAEDVPRKPKDQMKSKQILESLPVELIDRIRQTSKRKPVPVIPPIVPTKKRNNGHQPVPVPCVKVEVEEKKIIHLDHDYCSNTPRKDSGFSSCEEDDRSILRSQPTVKNADGKLMVSLLKSNTIKKKLNLEEYKKRLQNRSQNSSGNSSPAPVPSDIDENARRLKHQEKLMKMAEEIIHQQKVKVEPVDVKIKIEDVKPEIPSNMVMKTLVSVGTNTEESWGHLEQILQNAKFKISPNSLISSIVEHLPKIKPVIEKQVEHGEDKTIVYLDKGGTRPKMCSVHVQTIHCGTRRRRTSSSSSSSSESSSSSVSSRGSSRSRTPSPIQRRNREQIKEVEERRVIYVGKISDNTVSEDLRRRFCRFGPITNISVHYRRKADNYGFVTFQHKEDAYEAVEHGNDDPTEPDYVLSFGGRRLFCQTTYSDLDNVSDDAGYWSPISGNLLPNQNNSFDMLLKEAQAKLKKRQL